MLVTFGATFLGVIASFLLWFGGQWWIKRQRDKKVLGNMISEIQEEIQVNIALLTGLIKGVPKSLQEGMISHHLPCRMRLEVYQYAVSSGDIRLLEFSKQRLIQYTAVICESFNQFINNTEMLLAVFLMKSGGSKWARYRLEQLVESAKDSRDYLQDTLHKLQQGELSKEERMVKSNDGSSEGLEKRLSKIEEGIEDVKKQLGGNQKTTLYHFRFTLGFAAIAIATGLGLASRGLETGLLDLSSFALLILVGGLAIVFAAILEYRQHFRKNIAIAGFIFMFVGAGLVAVMSFFDIAVAPFVKLAGLLILAVGFLLMGFTGKPIKTSSS